MLGTINDVQLVTMRNAGSLVIMLFDQYSETVHGSLIIVLKVLTRIVLLYTSEI